MQVAQVLRRKGGDVASVTRTTSIPAVAAMLKARGIGAVVVIEADGRIAGILSERDIVYALADNGRGLDHLSAGDLMTRDVQTCRPGQDVNEVMHAMTHKRFRHLPVVDNGRLVGVISIGDAVKTRIEELENERNALTDFIHG